MEILPTLKFEKFNKKTKVWCILVFKPFIFRDPITNLNTSVGYRILMMFHRNKSIAEAFAFGNEAVLDQFSLCVTGDSSPFNIYWAYQKLQEIYVTLPANSCIEFTVSNPRLVALYKRRIKFAKFQIELKGSSHVFKIFKP